MENFLKHLALEKNSKMNWKFFPMQKALFNAVQNSNDDLLEE